MTLQDKVEAFFSKSQVIQIKSENKDTIMNVIFSKEAYSIFSDLSNHTNVREYFKNRKMKMIINESDKNITFSLVDIQTGDCLNIQNVKFIDFYIEEFLASVPKNRDIHIFFAGFSVDGSAIVLAPYNPGNKTTKIRGYSYIKNT